MASQDSLGDEAEQFSLACEVSLLQSVVKQEGEDVAAAMHEALLESQRDKVSARAAGTSDDFCWFCLSCSTPNGATNRRSALMCTTVGCE